MANNIRNIPGKNVQDPGTLTNLEYSDAAGSKKVSEVGRHPLPIPWINAGLLAWTTDASTVLKLPRKGMCLAVYNKNAAVFSLTLGEDNTVTALAVGATDASGHVGIPCTPNSWTYIACASQDWIITNSNNLVVFLIDDNSTIIQESR